MQMSFTQMSLRANVTQPVQPTYAFYIWVDLAQGVLFNLGWLRNVACQKRVDFLSHT
jgi:hypothetical protein